MFSNLFYCINSVVKCGNSSWSNNYYFIFILLQMLFYLKSKHEEVFMRKPSFSSVLRISLAYALVVVLKTTSHGGLLKSSNRKRRLFFHKSCLRIQFRSFLRWLAGTNCAGCCFTWAPSRGLVIMPPLQTDSNERHPQESVYIGSSSSSPVGWRRSEESNLSKDFRLLTRHSWDCLFLLSFLVRTQKKVSSDLH